MHSNYNRTGLQSEKDQNFGSDYFLCFIPLTRESSHLKKNKNWVIIRTNVCNAKIIPGFTVSNPVDRKKGNVTDMAKKTPMMQGASLSWKVWRRFVSVRECTSEVFHEKD